MTRRCEQGAGTVLVLALTGVVLSVTLAVAACVGLFHAHRLAQSAADLAALGGAGAVVRGQDPCAAAEAVAVLNGARVLSCTVDGQRVRVRTAVAGPAWAGRRAELVGEALAGPR